MGQAKKVMRGAVPLALAAFLGSSGARAEAELTPELVARLQQEQSDVAERISHEHGDKKSSELSTAERRDLIQEQAAARAKVLEEHGIADKDFARYEARLSGRERERQRIEAIRLKQIHDTEQGAPAGSPRGADGAPSTWEPAAEMRTTAPKDEPLPIAPKKHKKRKRHRRPQGSDLSGT